MSDSEDDYMSAKFLDEAADYENSHKEATYTQRRQQQLREQKKKGYIKPREQLQREAREEGLNKNLGDTDNKGMQMLMKMGFKKGMTLGKAGGLQQPISVDLKKGREGLGMAEARKRALEEEEEIEAAKRPHVDPEEYRDLMANRAKEAKLSRRSTAAAALCERLDKEKGIESNILWIFSPKVREEQSNEAEVEKEETVEDKDKEKEEEELPYPPEEVEALRSLPLDDRLGRLVDYLRSEYAYCFWCGAKYNDAEDLKENCPGPEEDDH